MITTCTADAIANLPVDWQGTYIRSRYLAYGLDADFAPLYMDEEGSVASLLEGHVVLSGGTQNITEWATFFAMHPQVRQISAQIDAAQQIARITGGNISQKKLLQLCDNTLSSTIETVKPTAREMYPLLNAVFDMPAFDGWYVDVSHRIRHGICETAGIVENDQLVSTAMAVAQCDTALVIGAVATAPQYRGKGYARQCIAAIVQNHLDKTIYICPKNVYAENLYKKIGFSEKDIIGNIVL